MSDSSQVPNSTIDPPRDDLSVSEPSGGIPGDSRLPANIFKIGILFEGMLAAIGLVLGSLGIYDHAQSLSSVGSETWRAAWIWGIVGTMPLLGYLVVLHYCPLGILRPMREFVDSQLRPMFRTLSIMQIAVVAMFAGFCEEILFRWSLQGGISSWLGGTTGITVGLLVASLVFGVCHWVSFSYALFTTIVGAFLGALMIWSGTWLAPAIAHTLFDFVALIYLRLPNFGLPTKLSANVAQKL